MTCDLRPTGETNWQGRAVLACTRCPNRIAPRTAELLVPIECRAAPDPLGLGDVVAASIKFATFGLMQPCESCEERRRRLNEIGRKITG